MKQQVKIISSWILGTYTVKFYDGVVQTVKHIHVKAFSKDQVRNVVLCFVFWTMLTLYFCFLNKDITCVYDDKSLFPPSDSLTRK